MSHEQGSVERKARIFNLQKYNMYDGPGVRSMAFLKGCPLRCKWCSNPRASSVGTRSCSRVPTASTAAHAWPVCPVGVHKMVDGKHVVDHNVQCIGCRQCEQACMYSALQVMGDDRSVDDIVEFFDEDRDFYRMSGGGITLRRRGLAQPEATLSILMASKARGYHTAIETCGYAPTETIMKVAQYVDLFLFDINRWTPSNTSTGRASTTSRDPLQREGPPRERLQRASQDAPAQGVNDSKEEIDAVIAFFKPYRYQKNFDGVDLLPYHKLGVGKYASLGRDYEIKDDPSLSEDDLNRVEGWIKDADFKVNLVRH